MWTADVGVYRVVGSFTVPRGVRLTVGPGVQVHMGPGTTMIVEGTVTAIGTREQPIIFRSETNSTPGSWKHIVFRGMEASRSVLSHCHIKHATNGIVCDRSAPRIVDCVISANARYGVQLTDSTAEIIHTQISDNGWTDGGGGVLIQGTQQSSPTLSSNTIAHNKENGIELRGKAVVSLDHNTFAYNRNAGIIVAQEAQLVVVQNSNFVQNTKHHLVNQSRWEIDARQNYWGWAETIELESSANSDEPSFVQCVGQQSLNNAVRCAPWKSQGVDIEAPYGEWVRRNPLPATVTGDNHTVGSTSSIQSAMRGYILYVYADEKRLLIDFTKDDRVKKDMQFSIFRGNVKVGMLKVEKVRDLWTEAIPLAASTAIQVGDRVRLEPVTVRSDDTWLSSQWYTDEWLQARLGAGQERYWDACEVFEPQGIQLADGLRQLLTSVRTGIIWSHATVQRGKVYFRKTFHIDAVPTRAMLHWAAALPCELYINEGWVVQLPDVRQSHELDVTEHLKSGRNIIAIVSERTDARDTQFGLGLELVVEQNPAGADQ